MTKTREYKLMLALFWLGIVSMVVGLIGAAAWSGFVDGRYNHHPELSQIYPAIFLALLGACGFGLSLFAASAISEDS